MHSKAVRNCPKESEVMQINPLFFKYQISIQNLFLPILGIHSMMDFLPHYWHILARAIGYCNLKCKSKWFSCLEGLWMDTHGLPVEYKFDKTLRIKGPEDVMKMGITNYDVECRKIVMQGIGRLLSTKWDVILVCNNFLLIYFFLIIVLILFCIRFRKPFTHGSWNKSGGFSSNSSTKIWSTVNSKLCLSRPLAVLHCPTSSRESIQKSG